MANIHAALYVAAANGHAFVVDHLLKALPDTTLQNKGVSSAFLVSATNGYVAVVETFIRVAGIQFNNATKVSSQINAILHHHTCSHCSFIFCVTRNSLSLLGTLYSTVLDNTPIICSMIAGDV